MVSYKEQSSFILIYWKENIKWKNINQYDDDNYDDDDDDDERERIVAFQEERIVVFNDQIYCYQNSFLVSVHLIEVVYY
jgi:hypothetical protein